MSAEGGAQMNSICIVVVTWNRLEMLKACVAAAEKNAATADILVVDNASTDGTGEWLTSQSGINVLSLTENTGGAGGFAAGMKWAYDRGYGWMWIMDDEVVPLEGALDVLWKVMRYLRDTGAGSWRMYLTYFYEVFKAMAITLVVEWNFKGTTLVLKGVMDGMHGRWGKLR